MTKPDERKLTHCPICDDKLYNYSPMGIITIPSCYCPNCDIVREHIMSIPYLCNKCYSNSFYSKDEKEYCWFCGNDKFVSFKYDDAKDKGLFDTEGYRLSTKFIDIQKNDCKHRHIKNIRYNSDKFKFICQDCGQIEYVWIPDWKQKELNIVDHMIIFNNYDA